MSIDAMKQALAALESNPDAMVDCGDGHWDFKRDLAITALRAAIEQAQEPVALEAVNNIRVRIMQEAYDLADRDDSEGYNSVKVMCSEVLGMINKLLEERQWQGLTDEDVDEVERWIAFKEDGSGRIPNQKLVRYIEAKLKAKNS